MGKIVDSNVDAISFRVVAERICPFSTNIAEFDDIFCTVASILPLEVGTVSVSP